MARPERHRSKRSSGERQRSERLRAERSGRRAEIWAALYLRLRGWRILEQRARTRRGEIDLIARRGRVVAFIEVKHRSRIDQAAFAIAEGRLRRVVCAVHDLAAQYARPDDIIRIDAILLSPWRWPVHMTNIWHEERTI